MLRSLQGADPAVTEDELQPWINLAAAKPLESPALEVLFTGDRRP